MISRTLNTILLKHSFILIAFLAITSCDAETVVLPDGFELIASEGPYHFVYMDPKHIGDNTAQRRGGSAVCTITKNPNYCEVHMWIDRAKVQTKMPIKRDNKVQRGVYSFKDGQAKLVAIK